VGRLPSASMPPRSSACCGFLIFALDATLPVFKSPANKHKSVLLTAEQLRYSFGSAISDYEKWAVPAPGRPLFEAAAASLSPHSQDKVDTDNLDRGPLLLTMGGKDHTVPESIPKSTLKRYRHSPAKSNLIRSKPGPLPDHRQRMARGSRGLCGLAERPRLVISGTPPPP
jgi:hypothetical protein